MIIQPIRLDPSGAISTGRAFNVSRLDPSGAVQVDAEHPAHDPEGRGLLDALGFWCSGPAGAEFSPEMEC
jgi:hypothetical protein